MSKKDDQGLRIYQEYEERKEKRYLDNIGNGYVVPNAYEDYDIMQEVLKESKIKDSQTNTRVVKRAKNVKNELNQKNKEYKESIKAVKKKSTEFEVFSYTAIGNALEHMSIIDKFVSLMLNRMAESGKLDILKNKSETILLEEQSTLFADCYRFISFICSSIKGPSEIIKFRLDSKFLNQYEKVITSHKFRRYSFNVLHRSISNEPSIIECYLKEGVR